jgi:hypothetical protein
MRPVDLHEMLVSISRMGLEPGALYSELSIENHIEDLSKQ